MTDEMMNHGHPGQEPEYEHEDLGSRGIFVFLTALAVSGIIIYFIIVAMYAFLDKYEKSQMTMASPLITTPGSIARIVTQDEMTNTFKDNGAPMLETNERGQFRDFLLNQENQLNSYGWVDEKAGVAHIPIERAMELIVQKKLPVCEQGCGNTKAMAESKSPAENSAAKGNGSAQ